MQLKRLAKFFIAALILLNLSEAQNVSKTGTSAAAFLEIAAGGAACGMGGAFVSIANDATALYWNPSGIADINSYEVDFIHTDWIADTKYDFAGLVMPLGEMGTIGLSFISLSMDDMKVRTVEKPEGTGEYFSAGDIAIGLSYARKLTDRFSIGMTVKYIQQKIWHMSASAVAVDLGSIFRTDLFGGMVIGASISNFGTAMTMEGRDSRYFISVDDTKMGTNDRIPVNIEMDSWELPLNFQIGISTKILDRESYKLLVAIDALHPSNDNESVNIGAELSIADYFYFRSGYQSLFLKEAEGGLSFGVGVNSKLIFSGTFVKFDYAYRDFGRLNSTHTFAVGVLF